MLLLALSLSACTSSDIDSDDPKEVKGTMTFEGGLPEGIEASRDGSVGVGIDPDGNLVVVHFGSSSNPYRVTEATLEGNEVDLDLENETNKPSTMDLVPTTSTVTFEGGLPRGMVQVELDDFGSVGLDSTPGTIVWLDGKK